MADVDILRIADIGGDSTVANDVVHQKLQPVLQASNTDTAVPTKRGIS